MENTIRTIRFLTADDWYDHTRQSRKHEHLTIMRFMPETHCDSKPITINELKSIIATENATVANH